MLLWTLALTCSCGAPSRGRTQIAADFDSVTCKVMDDSELWECGLHLLYSVGQGAVAADKRPRLVTLEYRGNPSSDAVSVALVGKVRPRSRQAGSMLRARNVAERWRCYGLRVRCRASPLTPVA